MPGEWKHKDEEHRADKQQGDPHALDVEGDPRGGVQSDEYRRADPRDAVVEAGAAGGARWGGRGGRPGAPRVGGGVEAWRPRDRD